MPPVTRAQVFEVADKISAAGQQPTVATVRASLGSGSFTTITALLREWRDQATPAKPGDVDVPEDVTAALQRAAQLVWTTATEHFRSELATLQKESARAITEANAALIEAQAEIENLESINGKLDEGNIKLAQELRDVHQQMIALDKNQATLTAQLKAAEARIAEQSRLLDRLTTTTPTTSTPPAAATAPTKRKQPGNPNASSSVATESPAVLEPSPTTTPK